MRMLFPGLFLTCLIAFISYLICHLPFEPFTIHKHGLVIHPIEPLIVAIVIGILLGNTILKTNKKTSQVENLNGVINSQYLNQLILKFATALLP